MQITWERAIDTQWARETAVNLPGFLVGAAVLVFARRRWCTTNDSSTTCTTLRYVEQGFLAASVFLAVTLLPVSARWWVGAASLVVAMIDIVLRATVCKNDAALGCRAAGWIGESSFLAFLDIIMYYPVLRR